MCWFLFELLKTCLELKLWSMKGQARVLTHHNFFNPTLTSEMHVTQAGQKV